MTQRPALIMAAALTAFVLVLLGSLALFGTQPPAATAVSPAAPSAHRPPRAGRGRRPRSRTARPPTSRRSRTPRPSWPKRPAGWPRPTRN